MKFPFNDSARIRIRMGSMLALTLLMSTSATYAETPVQQDAEPPSVGDQEIDLIADHQTGSTPVRQLRLLISAQL